MEQLEHSLEFTLDEQTTISPLRTIEGTTEGTSPANTDQTLEKTSEKWEGSGQETGLSDVFDEINFSDETITSQSNQVVEYLHQLIPHILALTGLIMCL